MNAFMTEDFLLKTETAKHLFHDIAQSMPIVDYHCHLSPREIYEDRRFENITQIWLGGDHYKWRLMRANGVPEKYITGDAPDREKFQKWAETLEIAIGNPLYHWSHLELKRYFGYNGTLTADTAEEVWNLCNAKLQEKGMSARGLIEGSDVKTLCTTDDPADTLEWHIKMKADSTLHTKVLPAFRPDQSMKIEQPGYLDYLAKLSGISGVEIETFEDLMDALHRRLDFFAEMGCCVSDHGITKVDWNPASDEQIEQIFADRKNGIIPSEDSCEKFRTAFMLRMGREYAERGWVMQLHYGCARNNSTRLYKALGPDCGVDCIGSAAPVNDLLAFLDALDVTGELPKTILYSLNPQDNAAIVSAMGCFQDDTAVGKLQHGSAWWFNDHLDGMENQMKTLANEGLLANFVGMLTDSRSFLSYARHEYFRRILCNILGSWVEDGYYPNDEKALAKIVKGICYDNAVRYFGFDK